MKIHLHSGAHKTATTHLQGILMANQDTLMANNIKLSAPRDVRQEWLPKFVKYCNNPANRTNPDLFKDIASMAPDSGLWILTEENIVGAPNDFVTKPGIYPAAGTRVACIAEIFKGADITFFFSLRSYDTLYRSAYSEVVRNRGFLPFSEYYDEERFKDNSWLDMVRSIADVLPQEKIILWKFEDFRSLVPELIQSMTGLDEVAEMIAAYKTEVTRPSLSQKTMEILELLHPVLGRKETLALVERINRAYPIESGYAAYQPFSAEQQSRFRAQYQADIKKIKEKYPGIQFLEVSKNGDGERY